MSEINSFSDYTSKYNSNVDYSALFGGTSDNSVGGTNLLSDYASIKNGSYSDTISKLFESTIDEKVGDKDKDKKSVFDAKAYIGEVKIIAEVDVYVNGN